MQLETSHLILHIDGGARGNPGPAGVGVVLADADDSTPLHEAGYYIGRATNNVAEYRGLVRGLELAAAMHAQRITVRSDSELLVRQMSGEYRVKSAALKPLHQQAQTLLRRFEQPTVEHVRRELNARADELANLAMDAKRDVIATDGAPFMNSPAPKARKTSHRASNPTPRFTL
ncbi:MAG: ribonuclease HI family protein, partial [Phycisphaeraceae bacterium]